VLTCPRTLPPASPPASGSGTLGIVAGRGTLPLELAETCLSAGREVFVLAIEGETDPAVSRFPHRWIALGAVGAGLEALRESGCDELVLIGPISRPDFARLSLDWEGVKLAPKLALAAARGDDALLSAVVRHVEAWGFRILGVDDVMRDLRAPLGPIGRHVPSPAAEADIARADEVVRALGAHDVGQGAVVCDGLVLAVEAVEGTDAMLRRCAKLPAELRGRPDARRGVLLKRAKPGQERRVDLPTIGPRTVELAAAAGLLGIAVEAGGTLVLERSRVAQLADELGLFVVGVEAAHGAG
jgi:UDP-2,3-diacylglucosamine hydrolase